MQEYKIIEYEPKLTAKKDVNINQVYSKRYAIADSEGNILDDANGYGYKTKESAHKGAWYKLGGGKDAKEKFKKWVKENKEVYDDYHDMGGYNIKQMMTGETTIDEIIECVEKKHNIKIPKNIKNQLKR